MLLIMGTIRETEKSMGREYYCPNCGVSDTRYRSTLESHICQRCGHEWTDNAEASKGNSYIRIWVWVRDHPRISLGVLTGALFLAAIQNYSDGKEEAGTQVLVAAIVALIIFCIFLYTTRNNQSKNSSRGRSSSRNPGTLICKSCSQLLVPSDSFCGNCGVEIRE